MKTVKPYLGFIPAIIVVVPCGVAIIRQALYYNGCMDGLEFVMAGVAAFLVGDSLNIGFLSYVAFSRRSYLNYPERRHVLVARAGTTVAVVLFVIQLGVVLYCLAIKYLS
ncbi:MAG: hypothetical protein RBU25_12790 [Lentisphaeria bacterium]|jgi:hypothetical protein|nr:hypothetical protein [Lentisphaeria bacterium]